MPMARHNQGDLAQVAQYLRVRSAAGHRARAAARLPRHGDREAARRGDRAGRPFWELELDPQTARPVHRRGRAAPARGTIPVIRTASWPSCRSRSTSPPAGRTCCRTPSATGPSRASRRRWSSAGTDTRPERREPAGPRRGADARAAARLPPVRPVRPPAVARPHRGRLLRLVHRLALAPASDIPAVVRSALVEKSLLFIGFRLDDWDFRVLFQAIKSFGGRHLMEENVARRRPAQPGEPAHRAGGGPGVPRVLLRRRSVNIYWGDARRFLDELRARHGAEDVIAPGRRRRQSRQSRTSARARSGRTRRSTRATGRRTSSPTCSSPSGSSSCTRRRAPGRPRSSRRRPAAAPRAAPASGRPCRCVSTAAARERAGAQPLRLQHRARAPRRARAGGARRSSTSSRSSSRPPRRSTGASSCSSSTSSRRS